GGPHHQQDGADDQARADGTEEVRKLRETGGQQETHSNERKGNAGRHERKPSPGTPQRRSHGLCSARNRGRPQQPAKDLPHIALDELSLSWTRAHQRRRNAPRMKPRPRAMRMLVKGCSSMASSMASAASWAPAFARRAALRASVAALSSRSRIAST